MNFDEALFQKENVKGFFRSHLKNMINLLIASKLTAFLDYKNKR